MLKQSIMLMSTYEDENLNIPRNDIVLYITLSVALSIAIFISTRALAEFKGI